MRTFARAVWGRPGWVTAAALLVWGAASIAWGERLPRNEGFGWDGVAYRSIAEHFPEPLDSVSAYSGRRCLPSLTVRAALAACGAERTGPNLLLAFAVVNVVLLEVTLAALLGCARALGTGLVGRWVLCAGFFLTYPHLKHYHYASAQTDVWATALTALLLLAYLRRRPLGVAAAGAVGAFVWPTLPHLAAILYLFPARPPGSWVEAPTGGRALSAAAATGIAGLMVHTFVVRGELGGQAGQMIVSLLPVSCALAVAYFYLALRPLLAPAELLRDRPPVGGLAVRLAVVVLGVVTLKVVDAALAGMFRHPNPFVGPLAFARAVVCHGASKPLLFAVAHLDWFGPLAVLAAGYWGPVCRAIRATGPGLVLFVAAGLLQSLGGESRQLLTLFPVVAVFAAAEADRRGWSPGQVAAFAAVAFLASRAWQPLNVGPWPDADELYTDPMQRLMMRCGYPTTASYLLMAALAVPMIVATAAVAVWQYSFRVRVVRRRAPLRIAPASVGC